MLYYHTLPAEIRIALVLVRFDADAAPVIYPDAERIQRFDSDADATSGYNGHNVAVWTTDLEVGHPASWRDGYQKVVEQIREVDAYLRTRPAYEEPVIEEENILYPTLQVVNTHGIRRLHRR